MKLNNLIESARRSNPEGSSEQLLLVVEQSINAAVDTCGKQTAEEQKTLIEILQTVDTSLVQLTDDRTLLDNPRLAGAYAKLTEIDPDTFWTKGLAGLRRLRAELWEGIQTPAHA